jgi:hypothetical protein
LYELLVRQHTQLQQIFIEGVAICKKRRVAVAEQRCAEINAQWPKPIKNPLG